MSAVVEMPCTFSLNSSTFDAQRSASSYETSPCSNRLKIDWSNVCIPYCDVPCAMAPWIRCVFSLSMMQSRMKAVLIRTSTAGARPLPSALRDQALRDDRLEHAGELDADLLLLVRREDGDDAVDRLGRVERVQRREHQVAGLGGEQRRLDRLEVAHLADEDDVGILAQRAAQRLRERAACRRRSRAG